ncbi:lipase family protein [Nocardia vaccinii]|uniref:lipase family protein n=1 Tax=Nocardia vaccinii TaxID=1822 RepID=UPI000834AD08|nr:lipase family protein [Nocardia vaccinii]
MKPLRTIVITALAGCLLTTPIPGVVSADPGGAAPSGPQQWIDNTVPAPNLPASAPPNARLSPQLAALWRAVQSPPAGDPIFDAWPSDLHGLHPGDIISARDVTATSAPLAAVPIQRALLLKFRTTDGNGQPSFGTATLVIPAAAWTGPGGRPVVVNALPINSLGLRCTPSYAMAHGPHAKFSIGDLIPPTTWWGLSRGYAVLIPDHEGPRMAYADPNVAGHIVLDAIRAVRARDPKQFSHSRVAIAGYSGGAIASYSAAMLQHEYAPELNGVLAGVTTGGLVTDYRNIAHKFNGNMASGILLVVALAAAREHPELLRYLNHPGQWAATSPVKDTCGDSNGPLGVTGVPIQIATTIADPLNSPVAQQIFAEWDLRGRTSGAPMYIYHAVWDIWIPAKDSQDLFAAQCSRGVRAVLRTVPGEHAIGMFAGFIGAIQWLDDRLRGRAAPSECPAGAATSMAHPTSATTARQTTPALPADPRASARPES